MDELRIRVSADQLGILVLNIDAMTQTHPQGRVDIMVQSILRGMHVKFRKKMLDGRKSYPLRFQPHETLALFGCVLWAMDLSGSDWERNELRVIAGTIDKTLPVTAKRA